MEEPLLDSLLRTKSEKLSSQPSSRMRQRVTVVNLSTSDLSDRLVSNLE